MPPGRNCLDVATEKKNHLLSRITVRASSSEPAIEHYVSYMGNCPDRAHLSGQLLQLRRWEGQGDLIGYDLALQQTLSAANHPSAAEDLAALHPDIGEYIEQCFGAVLVANASVNLPFQLERIKAGRQAWERRVLVGSGVCLSDL
jgi:hypothetical protein